MRNVQNNVDKENKLRRSLTNRSQDLLTYLDHILREHLRNKSRLEKIQVTDIRLFETIVVSMNQKQEVHTVLKDI